MKSDKSARCESSEKQDIPTAADVEAARARMAGHVMNTPLWPTPKLGELAGCDLWVKFENMQYTGSFKERGALNKLATLDEAAKKAGVIAASAGNHAQGVAFHARRMGVDATIVMPIGTPHVKLDQTRALQARIVLAGEDYEEASAAALEIADKEGLTFVHPFDDADVIAGQGTLALEMLDAKPDLEVLVVPIGGGGLIAGMALAAKARNPEIEVIGVQSTQYPSMYAACKGVEMEAGGSTLAEGIAVRKPGRLTTSLVKELVDDIVLVDERALERAVALFLNVQKTLAEGAGAAGLAALLSHPQRFAGKKVGMVLTGGNLDDRLLASVLMRELFRGGRISHLRIDLHDRPGELATVSRILADRRANVIDVSHRRTFGDLPANQAHMDITIETSDSQHLEDVLGDLRGAGYHVELIIE